MDKKLEKLAKRTVPPYLWLGLFLLFIFIAAILAWSIWGTISISIKGKGVVLSKSGLFSVQSPSKGLVKKIWVAPGEAVGEGTLVAEIHDAPTEQQLIELNIQTEALSREINRLEQQIEVESEASKKALTTQLESNLVTINRLEEQLSFIKLEYQKKKKLYEDQLIAIGVLHEAQKQIHETQIAIADKKRENGEIQAKLAQSYRTEELKNKETERLKNQQEALVIQVTLEQNKIYSPYRGKVVEVLVEEGESIKVEQPLVNVEFWALEEEYVFYAYFPSQWGKFLHEGSIMKIFLASVNRQEFGGMLARVESVSTYPVSEQAVNILLHNSNLTPLLISGPSTQAIAVPIEDPNDPSGYAWSSFRGPSLTLSTGIIGEVEVVIESVPPIYYLFPSKALKETSLTKPLKI